MPKVMAEVDHKFKAKVEKVADEKGVSVSDIVRMALKELVRKHERSVPTSN